MIDNEKHPENPESLSEFIQQKKDEHDAAVLDP